MHSLLMQHKALLTIRSRLCFARTPTLRGVILKELLLNGNPIGVRGAEALATAMVSRPRMAEDVHFNFVGPIDPSSDPESEEAQALRDAIRAGNRSKFNTTSPYGLPSRLSSQQEHGPALTSEEETFYRSLYDRYLTKCADCNVSNQLIDNSVTFLLDVYITLYSCVITLAFFISLIIFHD